MKNTLKNIFKSPLTYILILSLIVQGFFYSRYQVYSFSGDTESYLSSMFKENIFLGEVNYYRTPVYPYFCKLIELISSKSNFYLNIVLGQKILFFISIILFYLTTKKIFNNKSLNIITTLFYAINPYLFMWNTVILTEALTIVEITALLYLTISYVKSPKKSYAILIALQLLIMVMTRPANIYLPAGYLLFWILKYFVDRKNDVIKIIKTGLISTCIVIFVILLYCNQVRVQHGKFGLTSVTNTNTVISLIDSELYRYSNNQKIAKDIDKIYVPGDAYTAWDAYFYINKHYSPKQVDSFLKSAKSNARVQYVKYVISKTLSCGTWGVGVVYAIPNLDYNYNNIYYLTYNMFPLTFSIVYFFLIVAFIFLIFNLIKRKEIEWIISALFTIIFGNIFLSIVCAPYEWQRLSVLSIPTIIILIPYLIREIFILSSEKKKKKKKSKKKGIILKQNINEFFKYLFKIDINKLFREATDNTIIQFFRYLFVGGIAAVVNIGMLYVFTDFIKINYIISNILSFILGLLVNYILSKKFVFQGETTISKSKEFIIYAVIGVLGLGIDTLLVFVFTDIVSLYYMISKLISTLLVFIWNFGARKILYKIVK